MNYRYNSWPLGALPEHWQRPEPNLIKQRGYVWNDPREINGIFEQKLAEFAGCKYAVLTDCCTNGLFLSLSYKILAGQLKDKSIEIPRQTYVSVPMTLIHLGLSFRLADIRWSGLYEIGKTGVWDSAARFRRNMYVGNGALQVLSFQIKKRLPIGRGGVILTDDENAYLWLRRAVYDGRDLTMKYTDPEHVNQMGWHFYMTPEDAARGILIMDELPDDNLDTMDWGSYPPIDNYSFFSDKI